MQQSQFLFPTAQDIEFKYVNVFLFSAKNWIKFSFVSGWEFHEITSIQSVNSKSIQQALVEIQGW